MLQLLIRENLFPRNTKISRSGGADPRKFRPLKYVI